MVIGISFTFHLQALACPHDLRPRIPLDFALEKGISSLSEASVSKNLLKNGWRGAFRRVNRHFSVVFRVELAAKMAKSFNGHTFKAFIHTEVAFEGV